MSSINVYLTYFEFDRRRPVIRIRSGERNLIYLTRTPVKDVIFENLLFA